MGLLLSLVIGVCGLLSNQQDLPESPAHIETLKIGFALTDPASLRPISRTVSLQLAKLELTPGFYSFRPLITGLSTLVLMYPQCHPKHTVSAHGIFNPVLLIWSSFLPNPVATPFPNDVLGLFFSHFYFHFTTGDHTLPNVLMLFFWGVRTWHACGWMASIGCPQPSIPVQHFDLWEAHMRQICMSNQFIFGHKKEQIHHNSSVHLVTHLCKLENGIRYLKHWMHLNKTSKNKRDNKWMIRVN